MKRTRTQPQETTSPDELRSFLAGIHVGQLVDLGDVTILRLLASPTETDADLLEEGLASGLTVVTEIGDAGNVNMVNVTHGGTRPLLLIDGEEIVGAKQNRVFNASFLLAPGTIASVPVSCVEQGRWRYASTRFSSPERTMSSDVRAQTLRRVATSVTSTGRFDADQGEVWRSVETVLARGRVHSSTRAYADAVEQRAPETETRVAQLAPVASQVGYAAVRGDRLVVIDLLGSPQLFQRGWKKLARGLAVHVGETSRSADAAGVVKHALGQAAAVPCRRAVGPGVGVTLHGLADDLAIGAVTMNGHVYHAVIGGA